MSFCRSRQLCNMYHAIHVASVRRRLRFSPASLDSPGRRHLWSDQLSTVTSVTQVEGEGLVEGPRYRVRQPGLPPATYEVLAFTDGESFTWSAASPGITTLAAHVVTAGGDGASIELGIEWRGLLAGRRTARMIELEARTFARLAEQG